MRVLVIEDEPKIAAFIERGLTENAYTVDVAHDGEEGYEWARNFDYDLIILDLMLPNLSGLELCRRLRGEGNRVRMLMLTAKDAVEDRVIGLDAGADDYLLKPFAFQELLARLRALSRRDGEQQSARLEVGDLSLDLITHRAKRQGQTHDLSTKEFALLEFLMRHPDQVLSRTVIGEHVWGYDFFNQSNVVDVYIRYLRRKIDEPYDVKMIRTVRGTGYRLEAL